MYGYNCYGYGQPHLYLPPLLGFLKWFECLGRFALLSPVETFNEAWTLSISALAVPQILYSTEPILASGLDREGGPVVLGRLRQLSILKLVSEISHQSGKEACIHSTPGSWILLRKECRSYKKVRIKVDESVFFHMLFQNPPVLARMAGANLVQW